jgi:cation diffusion facilitator CzcD-associated flavoprotein CzcO
MTTPLDVLIIGAGASGAAVEREEKHPRGASLKLLALIAKNGLNGVA